MKNEYSHDTFDYDLLGRVTYQRNNDIEKELYFKYDTVGNLTEIKNSEDRVVKYNYDNRNLVTSLIDPDGNETTFEYDENGREIKRNLGNGNKIIKEYNEDGYLTKISNENDEEVLSTFNYEYDNLGNVVKRVEEDGAETSYKYDSLSRLIEVNYPKDKLDKMIQANNEEEKINDTNNNDKENKGDKSDNKINDNKGNGRKKELISKYANVLQVASLTLEGLLVKNDNSKGNKPKDTTSNKSETIIKEDKSNNNTNDNKKDKSNNGNSDNKGNDKEKGNNGKGKGKDESITNILALDLPEILDIKPKFLTEAYNTVKYTYDSVGNRISEENDDGVTNYSYNKLNQLISAGDTQYKYDTKGNLTKEIEGENTIEYSYNGNNQLSQVLYSDETYVKYGYDGLGRKVYREEASIDANKLENLKENQGKSNNSNSNSKSNNNGKGNGKYNNPGQGNKYGIYKNGIDNNIYDVEKTRYMYQGLSSTLHKEYSDKGSPYAEYYSANNQVISKKMFGLHGLVTPGQEESLKTNGGLMYYQYDGTRNITELTDRNGDKIEHYRYDAFGNIVTGLTSPYNRVGYTSQEYDEKAGLVYMNARWYNSNVGRFTTEDTYFGTLTNPQSQNKYAYVMNNPVNMWDPTGHVAESIGEENTTVTYYSYDWVTERIQELNNKIVFQQDRWMEDYDVFIETGEWTAKQEDAHAKADGYRADISSLEHQYVKIKRVISDSAWEFVSETKTAREVIYGYSGTTTTTYTYKNAYGTKTESSTSEKYKEIRVSAKEMAIMNEIAKDEAITANVGEPPKNSDGTEGTNEIDKVSIYFNPLRDSYKDDKLINAYNLNNHYFSLELSEEELPIAKNEEILHKIKQTLFEENTNTYMTAYYGEYYLPEKNHRNDFKTKSPINSKDNALRGIHEGTDIVGINKKGNKYIDFYSLTKGIVVAAGGDKYNTIAIYNETSKKTTIYLHAEKVHVKMGQEIKVGEKLGVQGNEGLFKDKKATGREHVHIEVRDAIKDFIYTKASTSRDDVLKASSPYSELSNYLEN